MTETHSYDYPRAVLTVDCVVFGMLASRDPPRSREPIARTASAPLN